MIGELFINGIDAHKQWGLILGDGSLSALMTPPANKAFIENESRLLHGKQVLPVTQKFAARDVTLTLYLSARNYDEFALKLDAIIAELQKGTVSLRTKHQPRTTYKLLYLSTSQLTQLRGRLGKILIKFNEPNPADRS